MKAMFHIGIVIDSSEFENDPGFNEISGNLLYYLNKEFQKRNLRIKKTDKLLISLNNIPFENDFVKSIPGLGPISFVYRGFDFNQFLLIKSIEEKQKYLFSEIMNALEYSKLEAGWEIDFKDILDSNVDRDLGVPLPDPDIQPIIDYYENKIKNLNK